MRTIFIIFIVVIATFLSRNVAIAQLPVEALIGNEKATIDIMFFKFFKNDVGQNSEWLFFNRNRASIDYTQTSSERLPQFGFTEAFSYNHKHLFGFAPVAVVSIFNRGVFPKLGVQYANISKDVTLFTWSVVEAKEKPFVDVFLLARYTPAMTNSIDLFTQIELVNAFATSAEQNYSFVQRLRFGLKMKEFQLGFGADFSQNGRDNFITTSNISGFLRYEF